MSHLYTGGVGGKAKARVTFARPTSTTAAQSTMKSTQPGGGDGGVATQSGTLFREPSPEWVEAIFRRREGASLEFCVLFSQMCAMANIRCKVLQGFAKNYDYRPGHHYLEEDMYNPNARHHWTAVYVLGNWHLIDVTWASGYTDPTGGSSGGQLAYTDWLIKITNEFFLCR